MLPDVSDPPKSSGTFRIVAVVVICMVLMKVVLRRSEQIGATGPEVEFVKLSEETLPATLNDWNCSEYELTSYEAFSSNQWVYKSSDNYSAVVSLDQLQWKVWHELTTCYEALDWKTTERTVIAGEWPAVRVLVSRPDEEGVLFFSLFKQGGQPMIPPEGSSGGGVLSMLTDNIRNRQLEGANDKVTRMVQCQVFVSARDFSAEQIDHIRNLHLTSRELFRRQFEDVVD